MTTQSSTTVPPPSRPTVEVWQIALAASASMIEQARNCLPAAELARARSFRDENAQRRHILAHAALRCLLANKSNCDPREITFQIGPHGKPALAAAHGAPLHFNLSHSGELALVAISKTAEVGADVEYIRPLRDPIALAKRYFTPGELSELTSTPQAERTDCFFRLWTQKEALLKATGQGIANGLQRFEVTSQSGGGLVAVDGQAGAEFGWSLVNWKLALPGLPVSDRTGQYAAACAVLAPNATMIQKEFTPRDT